MQPSADLEQLMVRYQQGDAAAVTELVQRLSPQLHRFFLAQFVSRRYADDLLQETWLRIHQVRHTYRPGEPVLPWLYALARNVRVDHFRRTRRREDRERQMEELPATPAVQPADPHGPDVEAMLRDLPESQREVLVMLKVSGMSIEEVARATSSSVGSVKQKAHRAYEKLRRLYEA
ncbi:MAG TPA: RNA polymerase sigma factor [Bryobacteraceae bacterium]|nr:RNA polymerase sigma factor [Bryobacteraceae bacterium]